MKIPVLTEQIKQKALELGFDIVGITNASPVEGEHLERLLAWLRDGRAGQMTWMHNNLEKRTNPSKLFATAKSLIVVGLNYKPQQPFNGSGESLHFGKIAPFAQYDDYHPFMKRKLRKLVDFIISQTCPCTKFQICVDSAPLLERAFAMRAGLGFIGKNRMLINPRLGPQILLGEIITNLELVSDKPLAKSCSDCGKCISACPTGALNRDGSFDSTKCIGYLTIESKDSIASDLATKIGNHLFGCSDCILACPYQHKAPTCSNKEFNYYPARAQLDLTEILNMTGHEFQSRFANSPILRAGLTRLKYIAGICLKNAQVREETS